MFKKLLIASTVLVATSTVAFAAHTSYKGDYKGEMPVAPCTTTVGVGPYLGLSMGPRVNITKTPTTFVGLEGTASLGYSMMAYPGMYLAGEVFGAGSFNVKEYNDQGTNSVSPRTTYSYGASIIPGMMLSNDVLGYLRAGVVRSRFNNVGAAGTGSSDNRSVTGWQAGLGAQTNVAPNLDVRGEYVFSQYNRISTIGVPQAHQVNVGLVFRFM